MTELKPCPFCGGEAHVAKTLRGWKVECQGRMGSCYMNARTHYQPHKFLAVTAWNTRTEVDTLRAEIARLAASYREACEQRDALQAEVARLRKALEEIAQFKFYGGFSTTEAGRASAALAHREADQ
jgi:hypothetical protein